MYAVYVGDKPHYFADEKRALKAAERMGGKIVSLRSASAERLGVPSGGDKFGVYAAPRAQHYSEDNMAIEGEIEKLTGSLKDGIDSLNKKVQAVHADFDSHIKEGHAVVDAVDGQGKALKGALAQLKAAMGLNTNFPPTETA